MKTQHVSNYNQFKDKARNYNSFHQLHANKRTKHLPIVLFNGLPESKKKKKKSFKMTSWFEIKYEKWKNNYFCC